MEFLKLIEKRRSVRSYDAAPDHEALLQIVKEAQQAPSWKNLQASRCYVLETPEMLVKFREAVLPSFNRNSSDRAALIVTTYVRDLSGFGEGAPANEVGNGWGAYDLGLHDAYLILAAKNAGYDTLIMGLRDANRIRIMLGIPENEEIMSVIAVGKSSAEVSVKPRKSPEETVKFF